MACEPRRAGRRLGRVTQYNDLASMRAPGLGGPQLCGITPPLHNPGEKGRRLVPINRVPWAVVVGVAAPGNAQCCDGIDIGGEDCCVVVDEEVLFRYGNLEGASQESGKLGPLHVHIGAGERWPTSTQNSCCRQPIDRCFCPMPIVICEVIRPCRSGLEDPVQ